MSLSLGTLEIGLGLNTAQYDAGIKSAKDQLSSLEDYAQKITRDMEWSLKQIIPKLTIVPSVDHRPLHGLNKHLSEKEKHIDRVSDKTIAPSVDLSKLDDFFEKLESIQDLLSGSLEISLDSSGFESSLDSMAESAQNSLQENLESFKQNTANFAKFATAPFEAVFTGVFEGIGNVISKKIGKGLESSLKKSTNISLEGIGRFLGDVTSEVLSQIDETAGLSLNVRSVKATDKNQKNIKRISSTETEDGTKPKKLSKVEQSDAIVKSIQKTAQVIDKITDNAVKFANTVENIESVIDSVSSILSNVANDTQSFKPDLANIKNIPRLEPVPVLAERSPSLKSNALNAGKIASEQAISTPRATQQNAPKLEIAGNYKDLEQNTDAFIEETMSHVRHQSKMYQSVAQALNKTGNKRERLKTLLNKAEKGKRELNPKELAEALEIIKEIRGKAEFLLNDDIAKRAEERINDLGKNLPEKDKKFGTEFQRIQSDIANRKNTARKAISATEAFVSAPKTDVEKQVFKAISSGQASQNWDKTTASIKENINEIVQESQRNSKKIQGGISEASPGPTFNARKNWKKTSDYIKEQIKLIVEESRNASKQIDGNFANPDLKRQLRLERVIESKLKQGQSIPSPVLSELKGIYTRPNLTSPQINDDYLNKLQKAVQIAIRQFGVNSNRAIQLLEKLESARKIAVKQETDKLNRIPKTKQEINERAELTKKRKEQEKRQQQKIEKEIQREVNNLNRLAASLSIAQSPERLAELEKKRQAIKNKYEEKRAKEFQDWLKTQKTIGINRNTNWGRQSRISELRQSISQRRDNTNQLIQREVNSLNRLASSLSIAQSPERLAELEKKRQAIRDKYEQKRAKEFQDWMKGQKTIGINRNTNWNRQSRISELRQSISQRRDNTNQLIQREIDSLNRISQPFASRDITEDYLSRLQKAVQIAIRQFGTNSNRTIELLNKLESAREIVAKQEADKANRVPKTKQEINQQAESIKRKREQEAKLKQETERSVQKEITDLNRLATSLSIAQSPERLGDIEAKRQAIKDKYEQKRAKEFQDWLKTQKTIGINRSTNWNRQSRISELRQSISQRRDNTNQLIQREVDGLNRISSPSFATKEINQDYLNKLQKAVQIAVRQFGANSNRTIELLNKLESARDVFIQQEANKAQKNQRIKSPQEWKSIKEQEKKQQQEVEKRVQEEIEGLRRLGRPDPKAMANIEARRKIILDRRAAREKEARERAELARLKQERQEETSLQGFLNRPLRALNRVRRSTFADAKIETLAQKYADFGTESYFDKFFRNMSNSIKRKISKDPSERETVAREGSGMLFGMAAMSNPLLPALASLAPLALPLLPTALAVSGGINMVSPAFQGASQRIQGVENFNARLNAVTGDPLKSDTEYKYLLGLAEKYRVSLQSLSEGYTQLAVATRGTKLEGEATKELFSAITASIKALRLNTFDAGLVLNAYTQIVAKGKISMEELRQQLGEKFPPTMSVFAKALGVSQSELGQLVAKGSLLSDEVLPKVTKILEQEFGAAAEKGTSDFTSALASMETALFKLDRNFTDIFGGMFAGITNLASGIVTSFSDNFRIISQLAGAFTIGVVAQVGIGLSTILAMPKIAPVVSNIQGFIMGAWKTGLITLTPFMSGILADVIDDVFNTENDLFTNMAKGTTNIIAASIGSLENISYGASGKGFFGYNWEKAVNPIQSIGNTLGNLFKSIPSGVFELTALTFMFEQLIVLGQMFLVPLLSKLWLTFKGMGGAIWTAATNAKSLGGVFNTLFASSAMAKGALVALNIALKAFVALGFMAFARSDFTNPLQSSLNESEQKIGASIDNIQKLLNKLEAPTLEVKVKRGDELPSKGLELNLMAILGDESSSYKSDDAIKDGRTRLGLPNEIFGFRPPAPGDLQNERIAKATRLEAEALSPGLEKYFNDYYGKFTLAQSQLLNSARDLKRVNQEISKALTGQSLMPETVGKSINLLNPFANEAKIIDASIQRLQKERTTAGLTNTSESKVRIREIDKEIKRLNDLRKEKIKPLDEFMTDFESLRKGLNSRIEAIDKQDLPEGAKKALKVIVEGNQKIVEETRKSLEEAGFYDILTPLESAWQKATDTIRDFEVQYEKTMRRIENKSLNDQTAVYRSNLNPVQIGEQTRNIEIQTQKERIKQFEVNLTKQQQTLEQYLSVPESGRTQEQVDAIEETRKATFEAEKELASARLSLAKSEYEATQDRLRKQQSETKLRVDSEIARKRIDVIRANPFGGVNASLKNAEIDVEERIQAIGLLYQQLADNTGNPIEIKSQIVAAELALEQARANLLQQQTSLQDYYRNLDRQIVDFNRQIEDYRRQIEDAQLSAFKENRSLSESYSDLVRELDKNLLNAQNQLLDTTDRIRVQQVKNRLLIPGTSDAGKELGDIFLEFVQGQADIASRGRTFQSRTEEIETSYISTLRNIRNLQEQQQEAERNRLRTIEDIKRTQENLNRTLADLIRQTNKELGFIPQSIKDIVTNLNTLPEPIKLINSELVAIPPNIKTSGEDLVKSIEETAEAIRKAKEGLILPAPGNFIPAPVWNEGGILPPPPSQNNDVRFNSRSVSVEPGFIEELRNVANRLKINAEDLLTAMLFETKGTLSPSIPGPQVPGQGRATGLIQFMPSTARGLGTSPDALAKMSQIQQLKFVEAYFRPFTGQIKSLRQLYSTIFTGKLNSSLSASDGYHTLASAIEKMNREHRPKARQILNSNSNNQSRTQVELDALRYDGNPANSGAVNRVQQIRRNQGGQGANVPSQSPVTPSASLQLPQNLQKGSNILVRKSGRKTSEGLEILQFDLIKDGKVVDTVIGKVTGRPSNQSAIGTNRTNIRGSETPLPDGNWSIDANHASRYLRQFNSGQLANYKPSQIPLGTVGPAWIGAEPKFSTGRSQIGFHLDDLQLGSAGCLVFTDPNQIAKIANWVVQSGANSMFVDLDGKQTSRGGQGGPEFNSPPSISQELPSPPSIAQIPTLPEHRFFWEPDLPRVPQQNQDNFWEPDLPPVPKDNPINFQSPNLPPVPNLPTANLDEAAGQIRNAEIADQNSQEFLRRLEEQQNLNNALDRLIKFRRQQEEDARTLERTLRDASENVADLTINSKGYLTVQEEINKSATEVSRQYRSQIESLQDQRRTLLLNADAQQKYSDAIKEILREFQEKGIALPTEFVKEVTDNIEVLAKNVELAKEQVAILDQAIEQLGRNQGVATLEASFRRTRDTVRSIRDRMNDLTIQRIRLENQSRPTLFDDSAILAERISLQKEKEELEDYLQTYEGLPQYAEYVANIRSEWEKLAKLRLERVALDASPNRGAAESFFSDIREGKGIGSAFSSLGLNIATKFVEGITKPAIDALTSAIDGFTKPITQAFESVFNAIIGPVGNFFTNALNSIFKPVGNIFSSIFGGGGGGGLFSGLLSGVTGLFGGGLGSLSSTIAPSFFASAPASAFSLGTGFSLFSDGGKVGDANAPIEKNIISAFQRERAMSGGRKPRLIVANEDELVLNPKETEAYLEYRNNAPIKNYANGGFVGGKPNYSTTSNNNSSNQSLVINNTNNVTVESRNDMGYSLNQLKERENAQNERTKKRFFG